MEELQFRISPKQLKRMIILETGSIGCLFVPVWSGGHNGILTVMLSMIGSLIYGSILMAIGRTDGGYFAITENSMHGFLWRFIWFVYVLRFAIRGAWMLSYMEYLIRETLYKGSSFMILLPLLLVCGYAGMRNLEGRARFVELLFWWVIIPLGLLFLVGLWKADFSCVLPREPIQIKELLWGDYRLMALFLPVELILFRMSALEGSDRTAWLTGLRGILYSGLWLLLVYVVTVGIIGPSWGHNSLLGVTDAMELITIKGGGLERLDILMILFWLVGGIVTLSAYIFQGQQLLRRIAPFEGRNGIATIWMCLGILGIYFCFSTAKQWSAWYLKYACVIDFPLSIGLPVIIWLIYRIKRKKKGLVWKENQEKPIKEFCLCFLIISLMSGMSGCRNPVSLEDRTYVEELHVAQEENGYEFRCVLAYMDDKSKAYMNADMQEQSTEKSSENDSEDGEYTMIAETIEDINREYERYTGGTLDYSHLQGIYLEKELYEPEKAGEVLENIREETQAVLSTPIYQENLPVGEQEDETLGDWLKNRSH